MAHGDWIPTREQDLVDLCQRWDAIFGESGKPAQYGWDTAECNKTQGKVVDFLSMRREYEGDKTAVKRMAKETAKNEAVAAMRDFANTSIRFNKKMTDADRLPLGIHPKDTVPTTHNPPSSQPDIVVENTRNRFEHKIKAINRETGKNGKPDDAYGVRYAWQVGGEKPASGSSLPKTKFSRKASLIVDHSEADKGKSVYYAACYENAKGSPGPWSPIEEGVVG
jgi:hypothetical protein